MYRAQRLLTVCACALRNFVSSIVLQVTSDIVVGHVL